MKKPSKIVFVSIFLCLGLLSIPLVVRFAAGKTATPTSFEPFTEKNLAAANRVIDEFLAGLKDDRYDKAAARFSAELHLHCNEQRLRECFEEIKESNVGKLDENRRRSWNGPRTGAMKSFDKPEKTEHPGGPLWESTLRYENGSVRIRLALRPSGDTEAVLAAFELKPVPDEAFPEEANGVCFNGPEIGHRLGLDHSIEIELLGLDGQRNAKAFSPWLRVFVFAKTDEDREPVVTHRGEADRWTDPGDGSRWQLYWREYDYASPDKSEDPGRILRDALPAGTYRIAVTNTQDGTVENEGFVAFSEPVVLDAANRHQQISLPLRHGGTLKVVVRDPATGKTGENVYFKRLGTDAAPTQIAGAWVCHNMRSACHGLFPGRYTFMLHQYPRNPDDLAFDFDDKEYTVEVADDKEAVLELELPGRPQTKEELDSRWPFEIIGTVKDMDGNGLSHAEITLMGYSGYQPGRKTTTADENGRYSIRFSQDSITWGSWSREKPTPEKPYILPMAISVERPGFVWKGVRKSDGTIVSDTFLVRAENGKYSRNDSHGMTSYDPEPAEEFRKKSGHDDYGETCNIIYARKPKTVDIVMQPAVRLCGELPFDEPTEPADPKDRWPSPPHSYATFDLPRSETASGQPVFYGSLEETDGVWRFDVSVLPYDIGVFLGFSTRLPASWKDDATVAKTDFFKLPPTGDYTVKLRWDVREKDGRTLRKLCVDSVADANGKTVDVGEAKPLMPTDYLLNRWTLEGTVRDDTGKPLEGAEVGFYRHNGWRFYHKKSVTTDADGRYRIELAAENRYPYGYEHHGPEDGELYALRTKKESLTQKNFESDFLVFLSDTEKPDLEEFSYKKYSTKRVAVPGKPFAADVVLNRNAKIEGVLSDKNNKPLGGFDLLIRGDRKRIDSDERKQFGIVPDYFSTDENGTFAVRWFADGKACNFQLPDRAPNERDMLRTHNLILSPGERYKVDLRLETAEDGSRHLSIRSVRDAEGNDVTAKVVREDMRARPKLGEEETKKGREIIDKLGNKVASMFGITGNSVDTLRYTFHRGDVMEEIVVDSYSGGRTAETRGITFETPLEKIVARPWNISFRAIENDGGEIRLYTTFEGRYAYGNGISGSWAGYSSGGCGEVLLVVDAETGLPKRLEGRGLKEEYFDWTPLGEAKKEFVPKRILVQLDGMNFDFRFGLHDGDIWLFDRSVVQTGSIERVVCRIDDVRIDRLRRAPEEQEKTVRDALRKYKEANDYWLSWYPKDLPEFGYTFHMRDHDDEVLSYEDIKSATNWFAEFKRKGISYIGVSRLLLLDIDALCCKRVVEDEAAETLEFDFVLKHEWMNAVGNGISGTWLGWFNGGVGKGTAVLDTKTMTLREIRTANYDERYSDYFEIKPNKFVPRRIVIDKHNGDRTKSGQGDNMLFDFRFKVYEPCLWLFDRSVETDENGSEKTNFPVWIDGVTVDGKPAVEKKTP